MAALTPAPAGNLAGGAVTLAAASAGGDTFPNNSGLTLLIQNTDSNPHTVTIKSYAQASPGLSVDDIEVAVPANGFRAVKGFGSKVTKSEENVVELTYDAVTGLKVAVIQ